MRSLRKRPRSDNLANQKRSHSTSYGRYIYLSILIVLAASLANYMWGDLIMLRGDGLVLRDKAILAASYTSRIEEIFVEEGQTVSKGDVLMHIESSEQLERLADLSTQQADLTQRAAEFKLRMQIANRLLPLAKQREAQTTKLLGVVDDLQRTGNLTTSRYEEILKSSFDASSHLVQLTVDLDMLSGQIGSLEAAREDAAVALEKLKAHYSDGKITASVSGTIGTEVPSPGAVYRTGDPMLSIYAGEAYILMYLPRRYLFSIEPGMAVDVSNGRTNVAGVIDSILPLSDALPKEFQNSFKPMQRNQLARIKLQDRAIFPVYEKVRISRPYW
ncbi:HlyD family secretion protein [Cohaesibacter marisflavi]|uniref:HlyD family secretion protein n=1 Tax=Cohaesibacter marisflavi TaxID=655353 RepID=UPI0029C9347E|nr:biotin/lipoyl-binding protein [Cohaesibacter marisflavi]